MNSALPRAANRLAREKSPYLLQHQRNPVDWFPWGAEAFAKARAEGRPIFLSVGYSTCHWCHVMERESFEDADTAALLNARFVSIKVDREERPDVDKIYMTFVQSSTGAGGWPMNVFLTPDLKPFYGGTYWPPEPRHGRPAFRQILARIADLWATRREELEASATGVVAQLEQLAAGPAPTDQPLTAEPLRHAAELCTAAYDARHGGFGGAPKFPQPSMPSLLLRCGRRFGDAAAMRLVLHTCERMAAGGIHDQLGGGFARYAVDAAWLVPHFEKMLYDNAQLAGLYLDAFLVSGDARHADTARGILGYVTRDLTHPDGGFYSAEDADSEGHEGKFYCWTRAELTARLPPEECAVACRHFGITEAGNFVDHSHPQPLAGQNVLSVADGALTETELSLLAAAKSKLLAARAGRVRPQRDDKVLASWNGLMLGAFARAHVVLGDAAYRAAAERNLAFLQARLWDAPTRTLYHRWREGERDQAQLLDDYAFLLGGVLDLYEATLEPAHLDFALALAESLVARFHDPANGGFWQSAAGATDLIVRVKDDYDGAEPSGNSAATLGLLRLAAITGRADLRAAAEGTLRLFAERLQRLPQALAFLLHALDFWLEEPRRVVIAGDPRHPATRALIRAAHAAYQPNKVVLGNAGAVEEFARTLPARGGAVAYVCTGTACQPPTSEPSKLRDLLA